MTKHVFFSHGEKGGVGKSLTALLLTETLHAHQGPERLVAVETDASNPDFGRKARYLHGLRLEAIDLREADGWMALAGIIETAEDGAKIIVNLPSQVALWEEQLPLMAGTIEAIGEVDVTVLWTINRQRDSLLLLDGARAGAPDNWRFVVVKNLYWGRAEQFVIFDAQNGAREIPYPVITLPETHDLVMLHLSTRPGTFSTVGTVTDESGKPEYQAYERSVAAQTLRWAAVQFKTVI